jgi:hypothetical protein
VFNRGWGLLTLAALGSCASVHRDPSGEPVGPASVHPDGGSDLGSGPGADLAGASIDAATPPDLSTIQPSCTGEGTACATGNPGACNAGHISCQSGIPTCTPDVTSQACYGGPAGTKGIGTCRAGSQSCVGTLGDCSGEVRPATEDCFNDLDDDCDGKVNDGCPASVAVGTARSLPAQGSQTTGTAHSARCPNGAFVTRAQIYFDDLDLAVTGVAVYCATPTLTRGTGSYNLGATPTSATPMASFAGTIVSSTPVDANCGTGASGLTGGFTVQGRADSAGVYGLGMYCGDSQVSLSADNKLSITLAKSSSGSYQEYPLGAAFEASCADNEVLVGFDGRTGKWANEIQPICAPFLIKYQ